MSEGGLQEVPFQPDEPDEEEQLEVAPPSLFEELRKQRANLAEPSTFDVEVPGWRGHLVLRLGPISGAQQQRISERVQRPGGADDADVIVAAFRQALGRSVPGGPLQLLADEDGDPVGLDERLAERLGLGTVGRARDVVKKLFGGANNPPIAITAAVADYMRWSRNEDENVDEEFLGE